MHKADIRQNEEVCARFGNFGRKFFKNLNSIANLETISTHQIIDPRRKGDPQNTLSWKTRKWGCDAMKNHIVTWYK